MTFPYRLVCASFVLIAVCAFFMGCDETPTSAPEVPVRVAKALTNEATQTESSGEAKTEPYAAAVGGFKFTVPASWQQQPPKSDVLLGEFSIPGEEGPARLTLSSAGSTVEENLNRWRGQFNPGPNDPEPRESKIEFDGHEGTLLELSGTFSDMFGGGPPKRNWRMLGAVIPLGPTNFFVKLTGPQATVTAQREAFVKFVESAKSEN